MLPNCNERLIITAILTLLLGVMCLLPVPCSGYPSLLNSPPRTPLASLQQKGGGSGHGRGSVSGDFYCAAMREKFYLRHRCGGHGFLKVNRKNKVVVQQTNIHESHPAVAIWKETCTAAVNMDVKADNEEEEVWSRHRRSGADKYPTTPQHYVRYRHETTDRYICFDRRGRIKAVSPKKVEKKGLLCMFSEPKIDRSFHAIQSLYNPSWHVAFNTRRTFRLGGAKAVPSRRGQGAKKSSCEAQFHSVRLPTEHDLAEFGGKENRAPVGGFHGIFQQLMGSNEKEQEKKLEQVEEEAKAARGISSDNLLLVEDDIQNRTDQNKDHHHRDKVNLAVKQRLEESSLARPDNAVDDNSVVDDDVTSSRASSPPVVATTTSLLTAGMFIAAADTRQMAARLQHAWAVTTRPKPKMRHIVNKRPRPSRKERNRRKRRQRRMKAMRAQRALSQKNRNNSA